MWCSSNSSLLFALFPELVSSPRQVGSESNWDIMQSEFSSRDFELQGSYLDSLLYALPQTRKRFYVVGLRSYVIRHMPYAISDNSSAPGASPAISQQ